MSEFESGELRANIEKGLKKDETPYIQELGQLLGGEGIKSGIHLTLGNEPEAAQRISDLLGIDDSLSNGSLEIASVSIANSNSNSIRGSLRPFVKETGIVPSLPLIQASSWAPTKYPRLWSDIAAGNATEGDLGELLVNRTKPIVAFSAMGVYTSTQQKEFTRIYREILPEYGKEDATRFTRDNEARFPAIALKRYIDATHDDIAIPIKTYNVMVGQVDLGLGSISVRTASKYGLKNDRIIRRKTY